MVLLHLLQAQYVVYTEEQLRDRKQRALAEVTSVLSIPDADAVRVLRLFKWCAPCSRTVCELAGRTAWPSRHLHVPTASLLATEASVQLCKALAQDDTLAANQSAVVPCRDVNRVKEEWFTDMDSLKDKIGLVEALPPPESASKPRSRSKRVCCCCSPSRLVWCEHH